MKTILAYGDSNTWGAVPMSGPGDIRRYPREIRWPGVLQARLGAAVEVREAGHNGRTTCLPDPVEGAHKNGAAHLPVALESNGPLDLVIIKLGTNDLKARFSMTATDIANGAGNLARMALAFNAYGPAPKVLLVAPAPLARLGFLAEMFEGGTEKSRLLGARYAAVAARWGVAFLDAGTVIASSDVDGIHLDAEAQVALGEAMAVTVREILAL